MLKFVERYPEFAGRPIYITGESYAGHYIPAISAFIHQQQNKDLIIAGFAIGNGWTDPKSQYPAYAEFAYENNLVSKVGYSLLKAAYWTCNKLIESKMWPVALEACQATTSSVLGNPLAPKFNVYDIRKKCEHPPLCYDLSNVSKFLAQDKVKKALKVDGRSWTECNMLVHTALLGDWLTNQATKVKYLLENNVPGLVFSGDKDFICNWRGGEAWTHNLEWSQKEDFVKQEY